MDDETKEIARINDGKLARLLLSNLGPILDQIKTEAESKFIGQFKSGKLDQGNSLAYAAVIGTIEDIQNRLRQKINTADRQLGGIDIGRSDSNNIGI